MLHVCDLYLQCPSTLTSWQWKTLKAPDLASRQQLHMHNDSQFVTQTRRFSQVARVYIPVNGRIPSFQSADQVMQRLLTATQSSHGTPGPLHGMVLRKPFLMPCNSHIHLKCHRRSHNHRTQHPDCNGTQWQTTPHSCQGIGIGLSA